MLLRRLLVSAWLGLLMLGGQGAPASAQDIAEIYQPDGRWVGMGSGGEKVFFPYVNYLPGPALAAVVPQTELLLAAFADPDTPAGQSLTARERAIVRSIRVRPSSTPSTGFRALTDGGQRWIEVPAHAAVYQVQLAGALFESMKTDHFGYLNLMMMSEADFWQSRSPRWYAPQVYARQLGLTIDPEATATDPRFLGAVAIIHGSMTLHEICHHLRGHVDPSMIARYRALDQAGKSALSIANETEADRCMAEMMVPAALPPDLGVVLNLASSVVMGDRLSNSHPTARARLDAAKVSSLDALATLRAVQAERGGEISLSDEAYLELAEGLWEKLEEWQRLYGPRPL